MHDAGTFWISTLSGGIVFIVLLFQIARIPIFKEVREELRLIRLGVGTINGRLGRLEEWKSGHERLDDELHQEVNRRLGVVEHSLGKDGFG
jgi:hypothetical protein